MTHYGEPMHRIRHFILKGVGILGVLAVAPLLFKLPHPEVMFYRGVGIGVAVWFFILAVGVMPDETKNFHLDRIGTHLSVLAWLISFNVLYGGLFLEPPWTRAMGILAFGALVIPGIAFYSHHRRYRRYLAWLREQEAQSSQLAAAE